MRLSLNLDRIPALPSRGILTFVSFATGPPCVCSSIPAGNNVLHQPFLKFFWWAKNGRLLIRIGSYLFVVLRRPSCIEVILGPLKGDESSAGACWNTWKQGHCILVGAEDETFTRAKKIIERSSLESLQMSSLASGCKPNRVKSSTSQFSIRQMRLVPGSTQQEKSCKMRLEEVICVFDLACFSQPLVCGLFLRLLSTRSDTNFFCCSSQCSQTWI